MSKIFLIPSEKWIASHLFEYISQRIVPTYGRVTSVFSDLDFVVPLTGSDTKTVTFSQKNVQEDRLTIPSEEQGAFIKDHSISSKMIYTGDVIFLGCEKGNGQSLCILVKTEGLDAQEDTWDTFVSKVKDLALYIQDTYQSDSTLRELVQQIVNVRHLLEVNKT